MRDLAAALNTWPNAIYGHFENKFVLQQALTERILDQAFGEDITKAILDEANPWEEGFRLGGRTIYEVTARYRGLGPLLTFHGMGIGSRAMQLIPAMVMILMRKGLSETRAATIIQVVTVYIASMGEMTALFESGLTDKSAFTDNFQVSQSLPMAQTMAIFYDYRKSERVVEGIDIFIGAIAAELQRPDVPG